MGALRWPSSCFPTTHRPTVDALLQALRDGATPEQLAGAVAYAAALRVARFHTANEFGDWDTVLHTFTFANAIHQAIRRIVAAAQDRVSPDATPDERALPLLRGVFDAATSVYLDRFLNTPAARLPNVEPTARSRRRIAWPSFCRCSTASSRSTQAGEFVGALCRRRRRSGACWRRLGEALTREDRDFHTIQTSRPPLPSMRCCTARPRPSHALIAAARYLAAHAPTVRAEGQTSDRRAAASG